LQARGATRFLVFVAGGQLPSAARRDRLLAALRGRIESAPPASVLRTLDLSAGHARIHNHPIVRTERAIQQAVAEAMLNSLVERAGVETERRQEISRLITQSGVRTVFHPIVRL